MSFVVSRKEIHCPNCHYEGPSKVKGTGGVPGLFSLLFFILGIFYSAVFFLLALIVLLYAMFKPAKLVCPECGWEHVVPLERWRMNMCDQ